MRRVALLLAWLATPLAAQDLPALYDVTGVAPGDVLNVRASPSVSGARIGELARNATDIEIVARSGTGWGLLNLDEGSGWASLRFLARQPGQPAIPARMSCFGTEPFWSLERDGAAMLFSDPEGGDRSMALDWAGSGAHTGRFALSFDGSGSAGTASVRREICSDGMSDRSYGLSVDLVFTHGPDAPRLLSGCCSLSP